VRDQGVLLRTLSKYDIVGLIVAVQSGYAIRYFCTFICDLLEVLTIPI
jgi:hypothetical protein